MDTFNWRDYESRPITRRALEITSEHTINWSEADHRVRVSVDPGWLSVTAACFQEPKVGDYIVHLNADDICHCARDVFLERNIVPEAE